MTSSVPQMVFLSENECPNAGPDSVRLGGRNCHPGGALTMWGYCGTCWQNQERWVPELWVARVDALGASR